VWIYEVTWGIPGYSCINVTAMAVWSPILGNLQIGACDTAIAVNFFTAECKMIGHPNKSHTRLIDRRNGF